MDLPLLGIAATLMPVISVLHGGLTMLGLAMRKRPEMPMFRNIALASLSLPALALAPGLVEWTFVVSAPDIVDGANVSVGALDVVGAFAVLGFNRSISRTQRSLLAPPINGTLKAEGARAGGRRVNDMSAISTPPWLPKLEDTAQRHDRVIKEWVAAGSPGGGEFLTLLETASAAAHTERATIAYDNAVTRLEDHWDNDLDRRIKQEEDNQQ